MFVLEKLSPRLSLNLSFGGQQICPNVFVNEEATFFKEVAKKVFVMSIFVFCRERNVAV